MANQLAEMTDETAAGLLLQAYAKARGTSTTQSSMFGLRHKAIADFVLNRVHMPTDDYVAYTFWAVKRNSSKSAVRGLGELVLKDVVGKLIDHVKGEASSVQSMASDLSGAFDAGRGKSIDTKEIYEKATKLGGQMQLHAAKKQGKKTYDTARVWGLIAERYHGGVVRFETITRPTLGVMVLIRAWQGSNAAGFVDRFQGRTAYDGVGAINDLESWSGDIKGDYFYDAANGTMI